MDAFTDRFEDRLEPIGIAAGALLMMVALGTLIGQPWATNPDTAAVVVQLVGILAATALGAALVVLSWSGRDAVLEKLE